MGVIYGGSRGTGIEFTRKGVICDTSDMSPKTIDYLVAEHRELKSERDAEIAERREKFIGYVDRAVEHVKGYVQKFSP